MYLNCKTWFSLRYGTFKTEELVKEAQEKGVQSLALTNINSTADTWDFVDYCREAGIKPVVGAEIRNEDELCYVLLAKNNAGFMAINRFISRYLEAKSPFPSRAALGTDVFTIYPLGKIAAEGLEENELIGVQVTEINKLFGVKVQDYSGKFVIRHPVTFQNKTMYDVHRLLRCIANNILGTQLQPSQAAGKHETFVSPTELLQAFRQYPAIVTNTLQLIDQCSISIDFKTDKTKKLFSASKEDDRQFLEKLALDGLKRRYGSKNKVAAERVKKELKIINDLGFNAYFLITWDILRYARSRGFFYVGRGSGANSIVAYCLEITDVDPIELDLYFERFLNPYRASPPDFDIDFSWMDRNEMTDYIIKRFGREHVALLGSYTTFQERAVIRELGKVFGLPKTEIDALGHPSATFREDKVQRQILKYGRLIKDFPNHLSVHAGGIIISEEPIHQYSATELPPKGFITTQVDMFIAEKIGWYKLDILSQRGLGHIKDAVELVRENQGKSIDIHEVEKFKRDKGVADKIRAADTIGCFYIESPGMRQLLKKLECDDYLTLVAASSIIRPGVAQSGMMRQYIYRYHHPDKFEYLHPKMEELLKETYGVMVYQEDVIKIAHHFGGLDMGEADVLRRAMSGKYRGHKHFELIREKYFNNCREFGYPDDLAREVWRQIESFGGYSFSKAHSASYAVESYQSLFLKTYYPGEFMVAVINNFGGFYSRELYFHELKRTGAHVWLPCVNEGSYLTSIHGKDAFVGFIHLKGLEKELTDRLLIERQTNGKYLHLQDFVERINPPLEQLNLLVRIGAFRFTGKNKKELLWEANFLQKKNARHVPAGASLFLEPPVSFRLPQLEQTPVEDAYDEMEILGFPIGNVWDLVDIDLADYAPAAALAQNKGKEIKTIGYFITDKQVMTIKSERMFFGTFLDKEGNWLDTVHFPSSFHWSPFQGGGFYELHGKVVEEFGVYSLEVMECNKVGIQAKE
ncbi:MAG: DNA polymerase III subunit alpha [Sphingobacteriales bacterium 50-39]|nr:DNA polymerase III subunit alpha [Sphingobacteriales bacterium]OJW59263.1 MAG: DNA polymerase III subunit alpha [Sphingobacteriales bacterium 50-39]